MAKSKREILKELCSNAYWHGEDYGDYNMERLNLEQALKDLDAIYREEYRERVPKKMKFKYKTPAWQDEFPKGYNKAVEDFHKNFGKEGEGR